jgi:transcriptional regulator GlxA family with amidase domain
MNGARTALPRSLLLDADEMVERAILTQHFYEIDGRRLSCCGGAAGIDFALTLIGQIWGSEIQNAVQDALYVDRVRTAEDRQRMTLQSRFGMLQPKLTEAVALMEANIEEPLSTDEIATLVGLSRRQLERQFRQFLDSVPSRYYLELRLTKARALLLDTNYSIVQVGLMCGFSSGSHFASAYGTHFGIKPRDERQRKLTAK